MEMSATVRWRPRTARGSAVKADYAPGLESRVRGNVQAQVRRGAVGNVPRGNALAAYSTQAKAYHIGLIPIRMLKCNIEMRKAG